LSILKDYEQAMPSARRQENFGVKGGEVKIIKGYRFVTKDLKSEHGGIQWQVGKWQKLGNDEPLGLCWNGFHGSQRPIDSLRYNFGTRWFECEAQGKILKDTDKFCASEMRLVREIPNKVIQEFAIDCAWRVLHIFEKKYPNDKRPRQALEATKTFLQNPCEENRQALPAARAAAWAAAEDAAEDAARDAARAAAEDAARDAAWDAAWATARDAAEAAERKWQNRHLLNLIKKEQNAS